MIPSSTRLLRGYILVEAVVSMAILSLGIMTIQRSVQQALIMRGQARDYTQARFLFESLIAEISLQPQHVEGKHSGRFMGQYSRFFWEWEIGKIDIPTPMLTFVPPKGITPPILPVTHITKVKIILNWERSGRKFSETMETLLSPERLFVPPPPKPQEAPVNP